MSSDLALRVQGLGKAYTIRHQHNDHVTLAQVALDRAMHPFRRNAREEMWALRDVSFELRQGEVLGLIGRNGAGKSTLLKLITRITRPSAGVIDLWGRVGSLLEVGTGFHLELTGRENIYLNGSILGMTRDQIDAEFDAIVDFADVERFLDTPVKRYSSGMYVRLAFAVAAHLRSEILLLDEVLAVGDADFQAKCLGKVGDMASSGRAVILVSHNMATVMSASTRALLLVDGRVEADGPPERVTAQYLAGGGGAIEVADVDAATRSDPGWGTRARIVGVRLNHPGAILGPDDDLSFDLVVRAAEDVGPVRVGQAIFRVDGTPVGTSFGPPVTLLAAGEEKTMQVVVPRPRLAPGLYQLAVSIGLGTESSPSSDLDVVFESVRFEVAPERTESGTIARWDPGWGAVRLAPPQVSDVSRQEV